MNGWVLWIGSAAAAIVLVVALDRLALGMERRGWIYYRKTKRRTGASLGDAFLEIQTLFEPDKRHILEARREEEVREDRRDSGDPPKKGTDLFSK